VTEQNDNSSDRNSNRCVLLGVRTEEDKRDQRGPVKGCTTNEWHCTKGYYQCLLCSLSLSLSPFLFLLIRGSSTSIYLTHLFHPSPTLGATSTSFRSLFLMKPFLSLYIQFYTLFHAFGFLEVVVFFWFAKTPDKTNIYVFFCTLYKEFNSLVFSIVFSAYGL